MRWLIIRIVIATNAHPSARYGRPRREKNRKPNPARNIGNASGFIIRICSPRKVAGARGKVLFSIAFWHELERRPAVCDLPHDVRQKQRCGDKAAKPQLSVREPASIEGEQQPDHQAEAKKQHAQLVQQTDTSEHAEDDPSAPVAIPQITHQHPGGCRPDQDVVRIHRHPPEVGEVHRRHRCGRGRQRLRLAMPSHGSRRHGRAEYGSSRRKRWQNPQREHRVAKNDATKPREPGHQRRVIHVAQTEPLGARDVVQLVAKEAEIVSRGGEEMEHRGKSPGGQRQDVPAGQQGHAETQVGRRSAPDGRFTTPTVVSLARYASSLPCRLSLVSVAW